MRRVCCICLLSLLVLGCGKEKSEEKNEEKYAGSQIVGIWKNPVNVGDKMTFTLSAKGEFGSEVTDYSSRTQYRERGTFEYDEKTLELTVAETSCKPVGGTWDEWVSVGDEKGHPFLHSPYHRRFIIKDFSIPGLIICDVENDYGDQYWPKGETYLFNTDKPYFNETDFMGTWEGHDMLTTIRYIFDPDHTAIFYQAWQLPENGQWLSRKYIFEWYVSDGQFRTILKEYFFTKNYWDDPEKEYASVDPETFEAEEWERFSVTEEESNPLLLRVKGNTMYSGWYFPGIYTRIK